MSDNLCRFLIFLIVMLLAVITSRLNTAAVTVQKLREQVSELQKLAGLPKP